MEVGGGEGRRRELSLLAHVCFGSDYGAVDLPSIHAHPVSISILHSQMWSGLCLRLWEVATSSFVLISTLHWTPLHCSLQWHNFLSQVVYSSIFLVFAFSDFHLPFFLSYLFPYFIWLLNERNLRKLKIQVPFFKEFPLILFASDECPMKRWASVRSCPQGYEIKIICRKLSY